MGMPTKYKPEYCEMLILHMKDGNAYRTFAAIVDVNPDTLYEWEKVHPEWREAKKIGSVKSQLWWDNIAKDQARGLTKGNFMTWWYNVKNRFPTEYRDNPVEKESNVKEVRVKYPENLPPPKDE
jgi:DNA-binding XRE family transcriptional regulator